MSELLEKDREAQATDPTPSDPDGDRGSVQPEEGSEDVLVPFIVPEGDIKGALTAAVDIWTLFKYADRIEALAQSEGDVPENAFPFTETPITRKAERVVTFLRTIAQSITASIRGEPMTITELVIDSHQRASRKGFWDGHGARTDRDVANEKLLLVISELTEAMEEVRDGRAVHWVGVSDNGKPEGFSIELADAMIRIADLAGWFDIDLTAAVRMKATYNEGRPMMHGKKF